MVYEKAGREKKAEEMDRELLAEYEKYLGPNSPAAVYALQDLSEDAMNQEQDKEALELAQQAADCARATFGPDYPSTLGAEWALGRDLTFSGQYTRAEAVIDRQTRLHEDSREISRSPCSTISCALEEMRLRSPCASHMVTLVSK